MAGANRSFFEERMNEMTCCDKCCWHLPGVELLPEIERAIIGMEWGERGGDIVDVLCIHGLQ
jgi:hypothetical protein